MLGQETGEKEKVVYNYGDAEKGRKEKKKDRRNVIMKKVRSQRQFPLHNKLPTRAETAERIT
jgi:hypothetical protein